MSIRRIVTVLLLAGIAGCAATPPVPRMPTPEETAAVVSPALRGRWANGFVTALYYRGQTRVTGYGAFAKHAEPGGIVFEIGSCTKPFTGALLAKAVVDGKCTLNDPVAKHVSFKIPAFQGDPISLLHLATHTSALPNLPANFDAKDPAKSYREYSVGDAAKMLDMHLLAHAPGWTWRYSDFGMALCGWTVSRQMYKQTYERALIEKILTPLRMEDTRIRPTPAMRSRLTPGHDTELKRARNWEFNFFEGAAALRSTPNDMLRWVDIQVRPDATSIAEPIRMAQTTWHSAHMSSGLGWIQRFAGAHTVLNHGGQTGGHTSYVSVCPGMGVGVIVMADTASPASMAVGEALMTSLMGGQTAPAALPVAVELPEEDLDGYVGKFRFSDKTLALITRQGKQLYMEGRGRRFKLYVAERDRLFLRYGDPLPVTFSVLLDRSGRALSFEQLRQGRPYRATREP